jgi:hypothetical protein
VEILLNRINERLKTHKFCIIFRNELDRVWPIQDKERIKRAEQIQAFAKANGLTAVIHDPGIRVTFRRAPTVQVFDGKQRPRRLGEPFVCLP